MKQMGEMAVGYKRGTKHKVKIVEVMKGEEEVSQHLKRSCERRDILGSY